MTRFEEMASEFNAQDDYWSEIAAEHVDPSLEAEDAYREEQFMWHEHTVEVAPVPSDDIPF